MRAYISWWIGWIMPLLKMIITIIIMLIMMTIYTGMRLRCCLKLGGTQSRNPPGRHSNLGRLEIKRFMLIISIWYALWTIITPFPLIQWCKHLIYVCIWKVFCKFIPANWLSIAYFYQFWAIKLVFRHESRRKMYVGFLNNDKKCLTFCCPLFLSGSHDS